MSGGSPVWVMDEGARRWLLSQVRKHYWRVAHIIGDVDDFIQEGHFVYCNTARRCPTAVTRPHIMRLFQISFLNHINWLSKRQTRELDTIRALSPPLLAPHYTPPAEIMADPSTFLEIIAQAPKCVRDLLTLLATTNGARKLNSQYRIRRRKFLVQDPLWFWDPTPRYAYYLHRETFNERLCGMISVDPRTIDMPKLLLTLFG